MAQTLLPIAFSDCTAFVVRFRTSISSQQIETYLDHFSQQHA